MNDYDNDDKEYLFIGEWLSGLELVDRLLAAQMVVESLTKQVDRAKDVIVMQKTALEHKEGIIDRLIVDMRDLARDLARVAGDTHREKNEAILAVIYRLLSAEMGRRLTQQMDDVPF
jgi:ATP/maltotriose-dependent transcriptional regulator MalT